MFKVFAVFSLLALLAGDEPSSSGSAWGALIAVALITAVATVLIVWLRARYSIVRRTVSGKIAKEERESVPISDQPWQQILSGEFSKKLLKKEK